MSHAMTKKTQKNSCVKCAKLKELVLWLIDKIRDVDAVSGEACYDMCQEAQRRMSDGKAPRRIRNSNRSKRNLNSKD